MSVIVAVFKPLPAIWPHKVEVREGVDPSRPGIYEWMIDGVGLYIGKYKLINRP